MTGIDDRGKPGPGTAAVISRPARHGVRGGQDGRDGAGGIAVRDLPAGPEPAISRPGTAPAYYLGRPARLWITVMGPRRRRTTSDHPVQPVTGGGKQAHHGTAAGQEIRSPLIPARSSGVDDSADDQTAAQIGPSRASSGSGPERWNRSARCRYRSEAVPVQPPGSGSG